MYAFRANLPPLCLKCTPVAHERVEEATSQNRRSSPRTSPRTSEQNIFDALALGRVCGLCMTRSILARPVPFPSEACLPGRVGAARTAPRGAGTEVEAGFVPRKVGLRGRDSCVTRTILARPVPFPSEACLPGRAGAARMAQRGALRVLCVHCGVCRCMTIMMTCL